MTFLANSTIIQVNLFQKHFFLHQLTQNMTIDCSWNYSSVPNRRAVRNKRAGGKILKKTLNVEDIIDVQGGKFS